MLAASGPTIPDRPQWPRPATVAVWCRPRRFRRGPSCFVFARRVMADHFPPAVTAKQSRRSAAFRLGALIGLVLVVGTVLQAAAPLLGAAGLTPVRQKYVALDFSHPTALPTRLPPGSFLSFEFQVANDTGTAITQPWEVTVAVANQRPVVVEHSTARVRANGTAKILVLCWVPLNLNATSVYVALPGAKLAPLEFHVNSGRDFSP